jgi:hypothetical protein
MRLQHVELPPRQVVQRGGIGGWERVRYSQWICPTCGHQGLPLPASR